MPLLPITLFPPEDNSIVTVPDDFSPPEEDRPSPMQIAPLELSGKPPPLPRAKMTISPPIQLDGRPLDQRGQTGAAPVAAQATNPTQDPAMLAFLADRAQSRAELAAAQKKGDEAAKWADVASGFRRMQDIILNKPTESPEQVQSAIAAARNAPVQAIQQRQQSDQDALKQAEGMQSLQKSSMESSQMRASLDPNSPESKRAMLLAQAQHLIPPGFSGPFTLSMYADLLKGADIQKALEHYKAETAHWNASLAETKREHDLMHQDRQAQQEIERQKMLREGARGKPIPAGVEQRILAGIGGIRSNEELKQAQNATGPLSPIATVGYGQQVDALAPEIAAANSPTGRESPAMVGQAEHAIPSRFTPNFVANKFFNSNRQKYIDRVRSDIESYSKEGYDVSGLRKELDDAVAQTGGGGSAPAATPSGSVKIVNGKRYEKLPTGQWVEH